MQQATCKLQNKSENRSVHLKLLRQAFSQGTALIDAFIRYVLFYVACFSRLVVSTHCINILCLQESDILIQVTVTSDVTISKFRFSIDFDSIFSPK